MSTRFFLCLVVCAFLSSFARADGTQTWEFRDGRWLEAAAPTTAPSVHEPVLDDAEQLLVRHEAKSAKKMLLVWEKAHKKSPARDRCIFLLADAFFQQDERVKSFFYCDELLDEYPESKLFPSALQKQFDIATDYLTGYKDTLLGFRVLDMGAEGVQMMWRIQQRSPGSPLAEKGLRATADYYFNDSEYDLAEDAYNAYIKDYPASDQIPQMKLQAAFSSLAQFRGVKFDASDIIDARAQLLNIQKDYPDLAAEENVQTMIDQIDSAFAKKLLDLGEFYQRTHEPRGAAYEFQFLVQTYPASPEAAEARNDLKSLPAGALDEPLPPLATGYAPATEPSADAR